MQEPSEGVGDRGKQRFLQRSVLFLARPLRRFSLKSGCLYLPTRWLHRKQKHGCSSKQENINPIWAVCWHKKHKKLKTAENN